MATAKSTKKAPSASRRVSKKAVEVKSLEDMQKELVTKHAEMIETRRSHRAGELVNPRAITHGRKEIARLKTAIRAHELKGDK